MDIYVADNYKPKGYASVSPYVIIFEAQRLIDFLVEVFGARETRRYENPDGSIMHAEVMIDGAVVMVADASETYAANESLIHVYVPDADAVYARALAAGAVTERSPECRDGDPDKRGSFKDFGGNTWAIATQQNKA